MFDSRPPCSPSFPIQYSNAFSKRNTQVRKASTCLERYCIAESGQWLSLILRGLQWNLFLVKSQNLFIFTAYTDACTLSCKLVVPSKRPLIKLTTTPFNTLIVPQSSNHPYLLSFLHFPTLYLFTKHLAKFQSIRNTGTHLFCTFISLNLRPPLIFHLPTLGG